MRAVIAAIALSAGCAFLIYRVIVLDRRVDELTKLTGVDSTREPKKSRKGHEREASPLPLSKRVAELERQVADLRMRAEALRLRSRPEVEDQRAVSKVLHSDGMEERILTVVNEEADRLLTKQLLFHRDNLMAARTEGVERLAKVASLSQAESTAVLSYLETEVDQMVELMRNPELREDPKEFIQAVQNLLTATDDRVALVLDDSQMRQYDAAREFERAILMPWLPKHDQ